MSPRIVQATPCGGLRLHLRFDDGAEGVVDLTHLKGLGVFARWDTPGEFEKVAVDPEWRTVRWPPEAGQPELDLCPDVLYHEVTGKPLPGSASEAA